jgi:hypothetical protein
VRLVEQVDQDGGGAIGMSQATEAACAGRW